MAKCKLCSGSAPVIVKFIEALNKSLKVKLRCSSKCKFIQFKDFPKPIIPALCPNLCHFATFGNEAFQGIKSYIIFLK